MRFVIVTGMSGAGKSTAMKMMEDMGFFCIDNLPIPLLDKLVDFATNFDTQMKNVAIGIDARSGENLDKVQDMLEILKSKDVQYEVLFLDAEDTVLVKRYKETRRSHPLAQGERVDKGIMRERQKMEFLKKEADYIIDTSRLLTRELKTELEKIFVQDEEFNSMYVTILSFGFKYGIPADSDIVMDVRFLPNPYYVEELRPKTGNDVEIQQYVIGTSGPLARKNRSPSSSLTKISLRVSGSRISSQVIPIFSNSSSVFLPDVPFPVQTSDISFLP